MTVEAFWTIMVAMFVAGVLAVVAYAVYEMSPFAARGESFRDPQTGERRWRSPHVD